MGSRRISSFQGFEHDSSFKLTVKFISNRCLLWVGIESRSLPSGIFKFPRERKAVRITWVKLAFFRQNSSWSSDVSEFGRWNAVNFREILRILNSERNDRGEFLFTRSMFWYCGAFYEYMHFIIWNINSGKDKSEFNEISVVKLSGLICHRK